MMELQHCLINTVTCCWQFDIEIVIAYDVQSIWPVALMLTMAFLDREVAHVTALGEIETLICARTSSTLSGVLYEC